jgi:hypothetical protein
MAAVCRASGLSERLTEAERSAVLAKIERLNRR